ncbi:MAG TPA: serine hydrolase domain-containing protein [Candidatus Angelobacter sp.]
MSRNVIRFVQHFALMAMIFAAGFCNLMAQQAPAGWTDYTKKFDAAMENEHVVGAGILVLQNGNLVSRHEYGFADQEKKKPVTERTIFHYGSITKTLTAVSIMQLRDRGRLSLDDHITRYIPELRMVHDQYGAIDKITIRMLLSHSAGFQGPTWPYGEGKPWEPFEPTTWNQLVAMMPYQELLFEPGSRFGYSNPAFIYLARIIEQLTGDSWETYVQKNIFAPLGMTHSYFGATPYYQEPDRSHNYTLAKDKSGKETMHDNGADFNPGITIPNGGWNAPLSDLAIWLSFLTNATHGDAETQKRYDIVLKRATLQEMWKPLYPTTATGLVKERSESIGLSFFILRHGEVTDIGHTGSQAGFLSFMYFNPANGKAVVAALNTISDPPVTGEKSAFNTVREAVFPFIE